MAVVGSLFLRPTVNDAMLFGFEKESRFLSLVEMPMAEIEARAAGGTALIDVFPAIGDV